MDGTKLDTILKGGLRVMKSNPASFNEPSDYKHVLRGYLFLGSLIILLNITNISFSVALHIFTLKLKSKLICLAYILVSKL